MVRLPVDVMTMGNRGELPTSNLQVDKATAASFGGQEGQALSGLGDALGGLAAKVVANQRKVAEFGYEEQFIKLQEADNTEYEERQRTQLSGAGEGWWQGAREATRTRFDSWLNTLPPAARAEYSAKASRFTAARAGSAFRDQYQQQDTYTKGTLAEEQRKAGLQVQNNPMTYEQFAQQQIDLIDKSTLPAAEKERLKTEARNSLAYVAESSRAQKDPDGYIAGRLAPGLDGMKDLLRNKEGFREQPYWDVNAWRVGYGSDTITKADGTVVRVTQGMRVTREDAERDLDRRIKTEFLPAVVEAVGKPAFDKLSGAAQSALVSLSYNYGSGAWSGSLADVAEAAKSGDPAKLAAAIEAKSGDNGGVNAGRRKSEAAMVRAGASGSGVSAASLQLTPQQRAAVDETAQRSMAAQTQAATQAHQAELETRRNALFIDLKEGTAPQTAYQDARRTGLLSDYDQIQKAENIIKQRFKDEADYSTGAALVEGGRGVSNPYNKAHRDGVTAYYDRGVKNGADPAALAAQIFDKTGVVPQAFATAIRGALISEDKARVAAGLLTAANMLRQNPNAMAGVEGGSDLEKSAIEYRRLTEGLGMSTEQAAEKIMKAARDPERLNPVKQEQLQQFRKQSLTQEQIDKRVAAAFSSWNPFSDAPFSAQLPTGDQRAAISGIYSSFALEGFERHRNPDDALAYADAQFNKQFGLQNGVITRYPPAKANLPKIPGSGPDGYRWINEQAAQTVKDQLGIVVDPSQIVLQPVERVGASTRAGFDGKPTEVKREDGSSYLAVPYQIVVQPKTPEQDVHILNGAFFPDVDTYVAGKNKEIEEKNATPYTGYDQFGIPFEVAPYQHSLIETEQQKTNKALYERQQRERERQAARKAADEAGARAQERRRPGP